MQHCEINREFPAPLSGGKDESFTQTTAPKPIGSSAMLAIDACSIPESDLRSDCVAWTVSISKAGVRSQCEGIARRFSRSPVHKCADHQNFFRRLLTDFRPSPPEADPDLIVSCGWRGERAVGRLKVQLRKKPLSVLLQRPKEDVFDLAFISSYAWRPSDADNARYHRMIGVPVSVTPLSVAARRPQARALYAPSGQKVATVLIGGSNGAYIFAPGAVSELERAIRSLGRQGWRVLVSTSPRTDAPAFEALRNIEDENVLVWDRNGDNPYRDYLAAADALLVTRDSMTMPCEALATGKPVYIFDLAQVPSLRLAKFERFHDEFENEFRLTRSFRGSLDPYDYPVLDEASRIADIIRSRM